MKPTPTERRLLDERQHADELYEALLHAYEALHKWELHQQAINPPSTTKRKEWLRDAYDALQAHNRRRLNEAINQPTTERQL